MMKSDIRKQMKSMRMMLSAQEKLEAAARVFEKLEKTAQFVMAERILIYHSLPDELFTHDFLEKWAGRKQIFLPRVNGDDLDILPYDKDALATGSFHIAEPTGASCADPADIELIVVPAVAFDRTRMRLGRGRGFYDRLLSATSAIKIGIGYDFQVYETLPAELHDIPMDLVITESYII